MASLCLLSKSRFHALIRDGVFPKPVQSAKGKRPYYSQELIQKCLEIRQTGIGANGQPVLFNRRPKIARQPRAQRKAEPEKKPEHTELLEALKGLGLNTTAPAVTEALAHLFPTGHAGLDQGDVIRKVFLYLQG